MKLYHWYSEALADCAAGQIIVLAENVKEARKKALAEYDRQWPLDAYSLYREKFKEDIAKRPTPTTSTLSLGVHEMITEKRTVIAKKTVAFDVSELEVFLKEHTGMPPDSSVEWNIYLGEDVSSVEITHVSEEEGAE